MPSDYLPLSRQPNWPHQCLYRPRQYPDLASLQQQGHWDSALVVPCPSSLSEPSAHTGTSVRHSTDSTLTQEFSRSSHQQRGIAPVSQHSSPSSPQSKVSSPESAAMQESNNQAPSSPSEALQNGYGHGSVSESGTFALAGPTSEDTSPASQSGCMAVMVLGLQGQNLDLERYFHTIR